MGSITIDRAVLEQALKLLDDAAGYGDGLSEIDAAYAIIQEALAAPQPEPVAFLWQHSETGFTNIIAPDHFLDDGARWFCVGPLYLHPPERYPLTDEEINALTLADDGSLTVRDFVRVVEKAHNIGGDK